VVAQERLLVDAVEQDRGGALDRLVEDRDRERVPQQAPRGVSLARAPQVLREGQPDRPAPEAHGEPEPDRLQLDGERHAQADEPDQQVQRRRERRTLEGAHAAVVGPFELQLVLEQQQLGRARAPQQVECRRVGPDHQVRAVVDLVAGLGVARGGGAASQHAATLQQHHVVPALLEPDRRREAGEAAAHHHDLHASTPGACRSRRASVRSAIQSLRGFDSFTRGPPTGWPRPAHSSSTAR
jgi:hypothetical protein